MKVLGNVMAGSWSRTLSWNRELIEVRAVCIHHIVVREKAKEIVSLLGNH